MNTANEYAEIAVKLSQLADKVRPTLPDAPYADIRNLMVYHIRVAAKDALGVAEAITRQELRRPVNENQEYNTSGE